MPGKCLPCFWIRGIFPVGHTHHLPVLANYFRQVIPDGNDIRTMDDVRRVTYRRPPGDPRLCPTVIAVLPAPPRRVAGETGKLRKKLEPLRVTLKSCAQCS